MVLRPVTQSEVNKNFAPRLKLTFFRVSGVMLRLAVTMSRTHILGGHLRHTAPRSLAALSCSANRSQATKAVVFDMGGVIIPSPGLLFKEYESRLGLPRGTFLQVIKYDGQDGVWGALERGEVSWAEFTRRFSDDVTRAAGRPVDLSELLGFLQRTGSRDSIVHADIVDAIKCVRAEGIKTALLTNNWYDPTGTRTDLPVDTALFDVIVESCKEKIRKPDPRIYHLTLDRLQVAPQEAVFLDDLGMNLKAAHNIGIRTIKVTDTHTAVEALGREVGFDVRAYAPGTTTVPERLTIDTKKLKSYLNTALNLNSNEEPVVRCYEHGQSNPTYFVAFGGKKMVLRKKPPGKLLPSAHAVEREYRVMKALGTQGVPVPKMLALCEEDSLLGTPFYIMEYVEGRIFKDPTLAALDPDERRQIYASMCAALAKIHSVDIAEAGLGDFGKQGGYMARNLGRWTRQYEASKTHEIPVMDQLSSWLRDRLPQGEKCTVIHGDYRLDNLIIHPSRPEVIAILDWELSTLGDPLSDLATNCMGYAFPEDFPAGVIPGHRRLSQSDVTKYNLPTMDQYVQQYSQTMGLGVKPADMNLYLAFCFFRGCAILQGVYKRFIQGQASSPTAEGAGLLAETFAQVGWQIASSSSLAANPVSSGTANPTSSPSGSRSYSTMSRKDGAFSSSMMNSQNYSTSQERNIPGALPLSVSSLSPKAQDYYKRVKKFIADEIVPLEKDFYDFSVKPENKWKINPVLETLKAKAKSQGLWNLFMPLESDPEGKFGPGLTNVEYAYMCEEMGKYPISSEAFNCSAPDTGNMEVLVRYANPELQKKYLGPLLDGKIRSCFGMTEPQVASSDATNIESSIQRDGDSYVINGRKWWTSGAMDPRCTFCIFMGKTRKDGAIHTQQSMIIVPMDAPGVKIERALSVLGYDDSPHGHAEVSFTNVRVPASNLLLGEGRGFEIAQGRLGPGRIHHCMRLVGSAERSLQLMVDRAQNRVAFGKPLAAQSSIQQDIAKSRIEIEQCRLLVLKAAYMMDTVGNKVAAPEIAMIKVAAPNMAQTVIDRAIQAFGGMGMSQDTPLAPFFTWARVLRLADGPDEVHMRTIFKLEARTQNLSKL